MIGRKLIYIIVILALSFPLLSNFVLPPAEMKTADDAFAIIEGLEKKDDQMVLISFDWGPSTSAENRPQTATVIEHLMRRRIPFAVTTTYQYAVPFLEEVPKQVVERLKKEMPSETWTYGKDWVNFGFQPGGAIMVQSMAKATDLHKVLNTDARGTLLSEIPCMEKIHTIQNFSLLAQLTGLVGTFNTWIQFFQADGYKPKLIHGCTSITIPEAYIYYVSGQISGLFEGVAGAAWYDHLLSKAYPDRIPTEALRVNTSLATGHLVILGLIILGNISMFLKRRS